MNKETIEALAREAAKGIKTEQIPLLSNGHLTLS